MTREDKKKQHRYNLFEKYQTLQALIDVWTPVCEKEYDAECWAYLRDLKRRKRSVEVRIKAFSL